ncbi:hypothetical protein [Jannaschia seohaensis]|uniref:Uncharacterized protein n=1 Tax=Jannaschia seohaensis TaxID=475081 RepID=A0A2Y9B3E8_9RHOB|nr:hypothetical protein [Jannaschia seohaensis]PWJ15799.1 hypothetical protein BCF38_11019 [Jannaschia seohaensis]SSA49487.1 hypothetical protein SAMN05421539_11019 [Jannaschia seohaensis]
MRLAAAFITLVALGATALAGVELGEVLSEPDAQVLPAAATPAADVAAPAPAAPMVWPALFGEPAPPAPPAPPPPPMAAAEPQPPAPPRPPLSAMGYELKGLVAAGDDAWGLVSHPTGQRLLRVGDSLEEGRVVARIEAAGLWISTDGGAPELLGFLD